MDKDELFAKFEKKAMQMALEEYDVEIVLVPKEKDEIRKQITEVKERIKEKVDNVSINKKHKEKKRSNKTKIKVDNSNLSNKKKEIKERREKIVDLIKESGPLGSAEISRKLELLHQTVYGDLSKLEAEGVVEAKEIKNENFSYFEWSVL